MHHYTGGVQATLTRVPCTRGFKVWVNFVCKSVKIPGKGLLEKIEACISGKGQEISLGTRYPSWGRLYPGVQATPARLACTQATRSRSLCIYIRLKVI